MAKIVGNVVGIPNPQSDWEQNDEKKADYIKNKPNYENIFANALKGTVIGETVTITDVSPIEHEIKVSLLSNNIPLYPYNEFAGKIADIPATVNSDGSVTVIGECESDDLSATSLFNRLCSIELEAGTYTLGLINEIIEEDEMNELYTVVEVANGHDERIASASEGRTGTFALDTKQTIYLDVFNLVSSNVNYNFTFKPLLFKGTEIAPVEIIVSDKDNNETTYYTDENGYVSVKSIFPTTIIQTSEDGLVFEVEYNRDVNKALNEHSETLRDHSNAIKQTNQLFANVLKGKATGEAVSITDVSPIEHTMDVKVTSVNNIPLYPYSIDQAYIGGIPYIIKDDGTIHISGICDMSKFNDHIVVIKELLLSEGYYTISANFPRKDWRIDIIGLEDFITIYQGYEKSTFHIDKTTNISIAIIPEAVLPNAKYDFELKPILFRGTEIIDMSGSTEVIVCDENHSNETTYHTDESGYVSVKSIYPTTNISASEGLNIEVMYNKDINKVVNSLNERINDTENNTITFTDDGQGNVILSNEYGTIEFIDDGNGNIILGGI